MLPLICRSQLGKTFLIPTIRYNSSVPTKPHVRFGNNLLAGIAGGIVILGAGYTWYHFSGIKKTVDRIQATKSYLEKTRDRLSKGELRDAKMAETKESRDQLWRKIRFSVGRKPVNNAPSAQPTAAGTPSKLDDDRKNS